MAHLTNDAKDLSDLSQFCTLLAACPVGELSDYRVKGLNCLHLASSLGLIKHVQAIVDRVGTQTSALDQLSDGETKRWTALMFAICSGPNGHPEIVAILLKAGASHAIKDADGKSALHFACESGQDDTIELLLANGADPNTQESGKRRTPLHSAIENGQFNAV